VHRHGLGHAHVEVEAVRQSVILETGRGQGVEPPVEPSGEALAHGILRPGGVESIAADGTQVTGELKVGAKVTIEYRMTATRVEVKPAASAKAPAEK
jgi:hypothetical protein